MYEAEAKAYQEQISSLNQMVIDLQEELYSQKQDLQILENDLLCVNDEFNIDFKLLFEKSPNIIILLDGFGKIKNLNEIAVDYFKIKKHEVLGTAFRNLLDQVVFYEFTTKFSDFIKNNEQSITFHFLQQKNKIAFSLTLKRLILNEFKLNDLVIGTIQPYDQGDAQHSNYLSHIVLDQLKDGTVITDEKGIILRINNAFTEITGFSSSEVLGKTPKLLKSGRHKKEYYQKMWTNIDHHGWWSGEIWNKRKNGEIYPQWLQINKVIEPVTKKIFYTSIFSDISNRKAKQEELDRLAHYDTLTGLVNRHFLQISLTNLLDKSRDKQTKNGILFLDLDHFKQINDLYGHHEGDLLLHEAAQRILATVRINDIVARVGGDEFIIVLTRIQNQNYVSKIAQNLIEALRKPFYINNNEHSIGASIGISLYPEHGTEIEELMSRADSAMYRAKDLGRNQTSIFRQEDEQIIKEKDMYKSLLLKVIKHPNVNNIEVFYQPIVNTKTRKIYSVEALLRIKDDKGNFINPEEIIIVAENEGLISELGEIIFREVCKFYSYNKTNNIKTIPITINLSTIQLFKDNFIDSLMCISSEYNIGINNFNFEITETSTMQNLENIYKNLKKLRNLGSKIYLDDFGTGYASLSQLHNLPVDVIKIDKSFTFRIEKDKQTRNLVKAMIQMSHDLACKVVIEGVETEENYKWLKEVDADYIQGYLISKAISAKEIRDKYLV